MAGLLTNKFYKKMMNFKKYHPGNLSFVFKIFLGFFILGILPLFGHLIYTMNNFDYVRKQVTAEVELSGYKNTLPVKSEEFKKYDIEEKIKLAEKIIDDQISRFTYYFIFIFIICLFIFIYLFLKISNRILVFSRELERVIENAKNGDYSSRVKVDFKDEFGRLGKAFNEMAEALSVSHEKEIYYLKKERKINSVLKNTVKKRIEAEKSLIQNQRELESIVKERTAALSKANQSLVATIRELNYKRRASSILSKMSDSLYQCMDIHSTFNVVGEACSDLFPEFSGAVLAYDDSKGYLKPVYQWNSKGVLHGALPVKKCPGMLYRTKIKNENLKDDSFCTHIKRYESRKFYCVPVFNIGDNIGMISINASIDNSEINERKWLEMEITLSAVTDYFKAAFINLSLKNRLTKESVQDKLTGLYNRRFMESSLKKEISRAKRNNDFLGVLMFDVDYFKKFNDEYGHEAGDKILREIGRWLLNNVRKEDIVCRYGGEEFLLILPGIGHENMGTRAESIRKGIEEEVKVKHHNKVLSVTVSIGACSLKGEYLSEALVSMADYSLYNAKNSGRNKIEICSKKQ